MSDFEEQVQATFGAEFAGSEPAADLRGWLLSSQRVSSSFLTNLFPPLAS